jgi:hypothetical protein
LQKLLIRINLVLFLLFTDRLRSSFILVLRRDIAMGYFSRDISLRYRQPSINYMKRCIIQINLYFYRLSTSVFFAGWLPVERWVDILYINLKVGAFRNCKTAARKTTSWGKNRNFAGPLRPCCCDLVRLWATVGGDLPTNASGSAQPRSQSIQYCSKKYFLLRKGGGPVSQRPIWDQTLSPPKSVAPAQAWPSAPLEWMLLFILHFFSWTPEQYNCKGS